mmetsp:Transcript_14182/g.32983  ORF Transcript_14182/g.32983 Transcript_14182/m.32983 type:complete len:101 (+) Transcript_14182:502-804(+)
MQNFGLYRRVAAMSRCMNQQNDLIETLSALFKGWLYVGESQMPVAQLVQCLVAFPDYGGWNVARLGGIRLGENRFDRGDGSVRIPDGALSSHRRIMLPVK